MTPDTQAIVQVIQTGFATLSRTLVIGLVLQSIFNYIANHIEAARPTQPTDKVDPALPIVITVAVVIAAICAVMWVAR